MADNEQMECKAESLQLFNNEKRFELNVGWACNNRCVFCSETQFQDADEEKEERLKLTTQNLLAEMQKRRKQGFKHITFLGGEPTIRHNFLKLVVAAKKLGFQTIFLTTNGRMLARQGYAEYLFKAGITRLFISLHGHKEGIHDNAVGSAGAFEQVMLGIENLHKARLPFSLTSVIFKGNVETLPELFRFQEALNPKRIFWAFVRPAGSARENFFDIVPSFEELDAPLKGALDVAERGEIPVTVGHVPFCRMHGKEMFVDELYWGKGEVNREVEKLLGSMGGPGQKPNALVTKGHQKIKHVGCIECRFQSICEGVHADYVKRRGFEEFQPVQGDSVTDPAALQAEWIAPSILR